MHSMTASDIVRRTPSGSQAWRSEIMDMDSRLMLGLLHSGMTVEESIRASGFRVDSAETILRNLQLRGWVDIEPSVLVPVDTGIVTEDVRSVTEVTGDEARPHSALTRLLRRHGVADRPSSPPPPPPSASPEDCAVAPPTPPPEVPVGVDVPAPTPSMAPRVIETVKMTAEEARAEEARLLEALFEGQKQMVEASSPDYRNQAPLRRSSSSAGSGHATGGHRPIPMKMDRAEYAKFRQEQKAKVQEEERQRQKDLDESVRRRRDEAAKLKSMTPSRRVVWHKGKRD